MKSVVYLDTKRNGYSPNQCGKAMTVKELIDLLETCDEDAEVFFRNDGGYTYGNLTKWDIEEDYLETEED